MRGDKRCIDGRLYRHDPQHDDPYLETDIGKCPECDGVGCEELERRNKSEAEFAAAPKDPWGYPYDDDCAP